MGMKDDDDGGGGGDDEDEAERSGLRIQYWWFPIFKSYVYNSNINLWKLVLLLTWINDSVDNILAL